MLPLIICVDLTSKDQQKKLERQLELQQFFRMSKQGKLNQETAEKAAREQETAISETNLDNCVLKKPEGSEAEEYKLSDLKTEMQVLLPTKS